MKTYDNVLIWLIGIKILVACKMFYMAYDIKTNYYMSPIVSLNKFAYVANDSANLIINAIYYGTYTICGVLILLSAINFGTLLFKRFKNDVL